MATQIVTQEERAARLIHDYSQLVKDLREMMDVYEAVLKEELNKQGLDVNQSPCARSFYAIDGALGLLECQRKEADSLIEEQDEYHKDLDGKTRFHFKKDSRFMAH